MTTSLLTLVAASLSAAPNLTVVTTTEDLASIARAVGGQNANVSALIVGARDPHRIEAKPSFMARLAKADLFLAVGLELEITFEDGILGGSRNPRIAVGAPGHLYPHGGVSILERPREAVTRGQGDVHPQGNPHYWLDPYNGRQIARNIADRMSKLRPASAGAFKENADAFIGRIDAKMFGPQLVAKFGGAQLWQWENAGQLEGNLRAKGALDELGGWAKRMAPLKGRPIVTYHRTFTYFARRFDLKVVEELEPKPGLEPSPGHLAEVVATAKERGVKSILYEPYKSDRAGKFVASRIGGTAVEAPSSVGQLAAIKTYEDLFDVLVARLVAAEGR